MKKLAAVLAILIAAPLGAFAQKPPEPAAAQKPPLLAESYVAALAQELSGESAKRNLEGISRFHRIRGSRGFHAASELIAGRARASGLSGVEILSFPADGRIFYGTQRSRPPWDAEFAELWEMRRQGESWEPTVRLADWDAMPITLAEDSESADVTADLVDVGEGTSEGDYAGKDVRGKIVLLGAQPGAAQRLAIEEHGAAGFVSYAQNQKTAWWGEDENLVRWGHLDTFAAKKTFAFMISLKTARALRARLDLGEEIRLHAVVKAGQHPGAYEVVTAMIPGADPKLRGEEIAFSCHLDHQRPGANDNASGCATILEAARSFAKLIREGKLPRPARTLRFFWPPEIEGTVALLNARPELAARIKAAIHLDMVGGGPATKAIFHVTRGPASLPSFVSDVAEAFAEFANRETDQYASTSLAAYPLAAPEGGKEALLAQIADFSMGSDHEVYEESSWRIPAIYMNDWPDRYIHTNFDSAANVDPTKLKRAAFLAAASGYFLARFSAADVPALLRVIERHSLRRAAQVLARREHLDTSEAANLTRSELTAESEIIRSIEKIVPLPPQARVEAERFASARNALLGEVAPAPAAVGKGSLIFRRAAEPKGPMSVFGYDYLAAHYGDEKTEKLALLHYQGMWGSGEEYAYEVLNLVDGVRNAQQIRDAVSAEYGPVPLEAVVEFLRALESIGVVQSLR